MKTHKLLVITGFCLVLAACQRTEAPQGPAAAPEEPAGLTAPAPEPVVMTDGNTVAVEPAIPGTSITIHGQGITFPFEHTLRYDRVRLTSKSQRQQRQAFFEVKGADVDTVLAQVTEAMTQAGYKAGEPRDAYGGKRVVFRKKGMLSVAALVRAKGEKPKLKDPDATASLYITITEKKPAANTASN